MTTNEATTRYTPGPWQIVGDDKDPWTIAGPEGSILLSICELTYTGNNAEANARLIAAAPDLLDALKGFVARTWDYQPCFCHNLTVHTKGLETTAEHKDCCVAARAALDKALGERS